MGIPDIPPVGLPEYMEPLRCLGEGGMGSVWSVRDLRSGRIGALKAIRPGLLTETAIVRRFEREMRTAAQLDHPYIVQILDVGRLESGAPYMLMEQIDGVPLIDLPLQGRTLGELIRLFDRILEALGFAHARRIIHRDLKPDNVLVYADELGELIPKLMDFGLAMVAVKGQTATRLTADGMVVGTPAYMAAEQACDEHHKICPATDLYAFGCMLYELLSGTPPHIAASPMALLLAHAMKPPRPFVPLPSVQSAERLEPLLMRLLRKDPLDRFEFAADVRAEIRLMDLLDAEEGIDSQSLGRYGDTIVGMDIPDELQAVQVLMSGDQQVVAPHSVRRGEGPAPRAALKRPSDAKCLVSVLNLREPRFVGRDEARNVLKRYVEDVRRADRTGICMVHGPIGIGKTRLVQWLAEDGETRGALRYLRTTVGDATSLGLAIMQSVIQKLRLRGLTRVQTEQALLRFFGTKDCDDWRVAGFMTLVSTRDSSSSPSSSSMGSTMGRLDQLLYAALQAMAVGRPLVLWIDDTQAAMPAQFEKILNAISAKQQTEPAPILIIVVDRTEGDMPSDLELAVGGLDNAWLRSGIHLEPLTHQEIQQLTHEGLQLAPRLANHVLELSDGLPLLAVALARQWHAAGLLEDTRDGYDATIPLASLPVPEEVQNVLLNQLELAFKGMKRETWDPIAQLAAVLGREFSQEALQIGIRSVPCRSATITPAAFLERTLAEGVVRAAADGNFEFANGLLREGIVSQLTAGRRTDMHRAAALAKQSNPTHFVGLYLEIARHLYAGRLYAEAFDAFMSAAREASMQARYSEANELLESAQQALASQEGVSGPWDVRMAAAWELELEVALLENKLQTATERLQWMQHTAKRVDDVVCSARTLCAEGKLNLVEGLEDAAARCFRSAVELLEANAQQEDPEHDRALAHALLALEGVAPGTVQDAPQRALELARAIEDPLLLGRTLLVHARDVLRGAEDETESLAHGRVLLVEGLEAALSTGDVLTEAEIRQQLAHVALGRGALEHAEKHFVDASRCFEALGSFDAVVACHRQLATLAREQGREGDARAHERWMALLK